MTYSEFVVQYYETFKRAVIFSEKSCIEGLLALEDRIDSVKYSKRDIFEFGIRLAIDGTDKSAIDRILSNLIAQESDQYSRLLGEIKKSAVQVINEGCHIRILVYLLNSYVTIEDDPLTSFIFSNDMDGDFEQVIDSALEKFKKPENN